MTEVINYWEGHCIHFTFWSHYHKPNDLKQQKVIISLFYRSEIQVGFAAFLCCKLHRLGCKDVDKAASLLEVLGKSTFTLI